MPVTRGTRRTWSILALAITGLCAFIAVWIVLPAPHLVIWVIQVTAREFPLFLAGVALAGIAASVLAHHRGATGPARAAVLLGAGTIALAAVPPVEAWRDARDHGVSLSAGEYMTGGVAFTAGVDPVTEVYAEVEGVELLVDIYLPTDEVMDDLLPSVVVVHGGGWRRGWRSMTPRWNEWLNDLGYAVFDVGYRLEPPPTWRAAPGDVKCATGWVRRHADRFGLDPDRIGLMGGSAGGHLSLLAAYTAGGDDLPPSCGVDETEVAAVVAFYPPTDLVHSHEVAGDLMTPLDGHDVLERFTGGTPETAPEAYRLASPLNHVSADAPPTFLTQGGRDRVQSPADTTRLAERLDDAGVDHELLWFDYADHAYDVNWGGWGTQMTRPELVRFLDTHLRGGDPPRR